MGTLGSTAAGAVARAFLDAFARRDIDAALSMLAEDVVWHVDGAPEVPSAGLRQGKARIKDWIESFPHVLEPLGFRTAPIIDGGTEAIVPGWFRYMVRPTGRTIESEFTMRFTVLDGLIAHYQIFEDSLALAQAFEADMAWPPDSHRINVNDTVYTYHDTGAGPVILSLSDGRPGRGTSAIPQPPPTTLNGNNRRVTIVLPPDRRPPRDIADDLALLIREKSWHPLTVVAGTRTAVVAAELSARHPWTA